MGWQEGIRNVTWMLEHMWIRRCGLRVSFDKSAKNSHIHTHDMGVHNFTWDYGHETVILSRHARNKYVNDGIILVIMLLFFCE